MKKIFACLFICIALVSFDFSRNSQPVAANDWFPYFDFDAATFQNAPREFGPFSRWWLPGNDIESDELKREIKMFADNGFAGVEVQPLTMGLNPKAPKEQNDRIYSWDSPSFYEHLAAIMQQGEASKVVVDMNGGSGWPLGGAFFDPKESMKTLAVGDTSISAGKLFDGALPLPGNHSQKPEGMMAMMMQKNVVDNNWATVQSVIAAKVVKKEGKQTVLDSKSLVNLTGTVKNKMLHWQVPADGDWQIVVTYVIPSGEKPSLVASPKTNYVIDHLDPAIVNRTYDYMVGDRTGLQKYYHKPLRAVFNDSYEFHTDNIVSPDFLAVFKADHGYDITPYLSAVVQKGYDHPSYLSAMYPDAKPAFIFDEKENWRLKHDYDVTVNHVFRNNFIKTSNAWMEKKGLLHRTQAYGFPSDLIANAGAADIPEAEQLFGEGSEGFLKLVTSGAHLNNRPVITQESFVSIHRAEMTTPQKIKMWADKSLATGINQFIYHGTPYKYNHGEFGKEGWNTWSSPYVPYVNFSTGMNETDPFWSNIKAVNQYITRCQYALRSGKSKTDVLIYFPFIDFTENQLTPNPEEILNLGHLKGIEPDISGFGVFDPPKTPINDYYRALWKTVNDLEKEGISWEFVNDESLKEAKLVSGKIDIQGNQFQGLILANAPYITVESARKINVLSEAGMKLLTVGKLPEKQPSFYNYEPNDLLVKLLIEEAVKQKSSSELTFSSLTSTGFKFSGKVGRQITREMSDGSQIRFVWNQSDQWQNVSINLSYKFTTSYFMNPENGKIEKNAAGNLTYRIPPYGSVLLYASTKKSVPANLISAAPQSSENAREIINIQNWNLKAGEVVLQNTRLTDWKNDEKLKYTSDPGLYSSVFTIPASANSGTYFLDLGKVYFTAEVTINGKLAGTRLFAPYELNISKFVKPGENQIQVRVIPTRRNGFIGESIKGNPMYIQYKGKEQSLVSAGLEGPVKILQQ